MQVTMDHYLAKLRMSHLPRVIVEGNTDAYSIEKLLNSIFDGNAKLKIDDASSIQDEALRYLGKREKLEILANRFAQSGLTTKPVHFLVDREFRDTSPQGIPLTPEIPEVVDGCLYWTWGHSIENYLFDKDIVAEFFDTELSQDCASTANQLLDETYAEMVRSAFAITKVVWNQDKPTALINTLGSRCFDSNHLFRVHLWGNELTKQRHEPELISKLVVELGYLFEDKSTDFTAAQWYSHGHLSFRLQVGLIQSILVSLGDQFWEAKTVAKKGEYDLHFALSRAWAKCAKMGSTRRPEELIKSIGCSTEITEGNAEA